MHGENFTLLIVLDCNLWRKPLFSLFREQMFEKLEEQIVLSLSLRTWERRKKEARREDEKKLLVTLAEERLHRRNVSGNSLSVGPRKNAAAFRALLGTSRRANFARGDDTDWPASRSWPRFRRNTTRRAGPVQGWYCANRGCTCGSAKFRSVRYGARAGKPWKYFLECR